MNRKRDVAFKATVAFEAAMGQKTIAQLASEYGVHPNQIGQWKKRLLEDLLMIFTDKRFSDKDKEREELESELYKQIGQLKKINKKIGRFYFSLFSSFICLPFDFIIASTLYSLAIPFFLIILIFFVNK